MDLSVNVSRLFAEVNAAKADYEVASERLADVRVDADRRIKEATADFEKASKVFNEKKTRFTNELSKRDLIGATA